MFKSTSIAVVVVALGVLGGSAAAQNLDMSGLVNANLAFDQQMDQFAVQIAQQWYNDRQAWRAATGYYGYLPGPVSTADLVRANQGIQQAWSGYNAGWNQNQVATHGALDRSSQAFRGYATYTNPWTGQSYELPHGYDHYWTDAQGNFHGSWAGGGSWMGPGYTELYPAY